MNDADAINELRDRLGRAEDRLSKGDGQFTAVLTGLESVTAHLLRQDEMYANLDSKLDKQAASTKTIVEMWDGAANATQFFCRLARGWEWTVKQLLSKRFIGLMVGYISIHYYLYHSLPNWTSWAVDVYKIVQGI
jgi:hypothetical protein